MASCFINKGMRSDLPNTGHDGQATAMRCIAATKFSRLYKLYEAFHTPFFSPYTTTQRLTRQNVSLPGAQMQMKPSRNCKVSSHNPFPDHQITMRGQSHLSYRLMPVTEIRCLPTAGQKTDHLFQQVPDQHRDMKH